MNNGHEHGKKEEVEQMAVCGLYICTSGLLGPNLGSDEQDICLLGYSLIDLNSNQVLGVQEYVVQPSNCDLNSNFLSDEVKEETRLTEAAIRTSGVTLEKAINLFSSYCRSLNVDLSTLLFITDGQLPLRQCLHPEASDKGLELPEEYNRFADLRKDIARFYRAGDSKFNSVTDLLTFLDIPNSGDTSFFSKELKDIVNIIQRLILDGYKFNVIETINILLEPGICSKDEDVDDNCVVRARGLPWQSSDQDIARFFRGLNIAKGGVALCLSPMGRRNGEALVRFFSSEHRDMALKRHKHHIGQRYIEVYRANGDDFVSVAGGSNNEAQAFLTRGAQVIIRMRGLPYDCTAQQVIEFFENGENPCSVMDGEQGLLFVKRPDGRSTGDAFVLFKDESDAPKAISRHRDTIGTRYIELFRSTTAEVQQVLNRTMETYESQQLPLPPPPVVPSHMPPPPALPLPPVPLLPQHIITSGTKKDCIRLRGLPYEALIEHILEFLGEHAKNIAYQGVHMVYNSQGQPSGEAFIQMDCEASAQKAAHFRHHKYMSFGKKLRYIEVFQCSGEDMNQVLSGGLAAPGSLSSPTGPDVPASVVSSQQAPPPPSVQQPNLLAAAVQAAAAKQLLSPGIIDMAAMQAAAAMSAPPPPHGFPYYPGALNFFQDPAPPQPHQYYFVPKVVMPMKRSWAEAFYPHHSPQAHLFAAGPPPNLQHNPHFLQQLAASFVTGAPPNPKRIHFSPPATSANMAAAAAAVAAAQPSQPPVSSSSSPVTPSTVSAQPHLLQRFYPTL